MSWIFCFVSIRRRDKWLRLWLLYCLPQDKLFCIKGNYYTHKSIIISIKIHKTWNGKNHKPFTHLKHLPTTSLLTYTHTESSTNERVTDCLESERKESKCFNMIFCFFQISLHCSGTCITINVWTLVLRPSTTPRKGGVSRALTTAGSAQAQLAASSVTPPTTSLMACVQSWSAEKVNKVTVWFVSFFSFICCFTVSEMTLKTTVSHLSAHHFLTLFFWLFFLFCCPSKLSFFFLRGGGGSRLRRLHGLWGGLQEMCLV